MQHRIVNATFIGNGTLNKVLDTATKTGSNKELRHTEQSNLMTSQELWWWVTRNKQHVCTNEHTWMSMQLFIRNIQGSYPLLLTPFVSLWRHLNCICTQTCSFGSTSLWWWWKNLWLWSYRSLSATGSPGLRKFGFLILSSKFWRHSAVVDWWPDTQEWRCFCCWSPLLAGNTMSLLASVHLKQIRTGFSCKSSSI